MSTFSTNLYIELIGTGEQTGTWGGTTNNSLVYAIEEPIVGRAAVAFTDANVTLTPVSLNTNQTFRNLYLNCTGTNTTTRSLIVPTINKNYYIENNTNQSLLVKTAAGTGITVLSGYTCAVYIDGTNVVQAATYQPVMTVGTLSLTNSLTTAYGGTGLASYTAGDTLYYSSGTTLSKLAIGATGTVLTVAGGLPTWAVVPANVASFSAGTTGLTPNTATTGAIVLEGTLAIANGGTGSTSTTYCALATNVSGTLPIANGGTGSTSTTYCALATNVSGTLPVANGGTGVTSSTGSGANVLGTSPTLITPALGTPTALVATNATGTANSLNAGVGVNQTWQSFTGSRSGSTTYYNTTGKPIIFSVNANSGGTQQSYVIITVDGLDIVRNGDLNGNGGANFGAGYALVPNGSSYSALANFGVYSWFELR